MQVLFVWPVLIQVKRLVRSKLQPVGNTGSLYPLAFSGNLDTGVSLLGPLHRFQDGFRKYGHFIGGASLSLTNTNWPGFTFAPLFF